MLVIWIGALFVLSGLLFMATQPIRRGRLSEARRKRASAVPRDTTMKPAEPMTLDHVPSIDRVPGQIQHLR
jgi:hypothetical protein